MDIKEIPVIKSDERGKIYDCDKCNIVMRKKGTISADHSHKEQEVNYLLLGELDSSDSDNERV